MGDEGEKTCRLYVEEVDLTDQQLKPCKCGYESDNSDNDTSEEGSIVDDE